MKILLRLFLAFAKIGLFTFGGGYAMIAMIEKEMVENKKWLTEEEFADLVVIAESTPGPIAINLATYTGYKVKNVLGSIFATIAVALPSFTIIFLISLFFDKFLEFEYVNYAFRGIQVCVIFLILKAGISMLKKMHKDPLSIILSSLTFIVMIVFSILSITFSSIYYILIGAFVGLITYLIAKIIDSKKNKKLNKEEVE